MRCCSCKYKPMLDGWDTDETYPDVCGLVADNEVTEYLYQGRYEIGCKFNQKTLDKRKEKLDNFYKNCNEYYG
ncbi:MAG: hypothetical protein J6Q32_05975 [Clostridia bacterium]|nr:hypothetical protein [Clostridia bacterium]